MKTEPTKEHQWLQQLVGTWTYEGSCLMGPDEPKALSSGRETVRSLGGLWVVAEAQGLMPGGEDCETIMQLGFDPESGRYKGTWIGSPMPMLWLYDGSVDASGRILTLEARGPSMAGDGSLADYQDIIEMVAPDKRRFSSRMKKPDGTWYAFMWADYVRTAG